MSTVSTTTTITLNGHTFKIQISSDDVVVPPTTVKALAGNDFTANIMENQPDITISLDGSQSTGDISKVVWAQQAGPTPVKIKDDSKLQTDFVASVAGIYSFILAVGDSAGAASTDGLVITVTKAGVLPPPPPPTDRDPGLPSGNWIEQPQKGADKNPHGWRVVTMVKDPNMSKVVDSAQINVAVEFPTKAAAQQYIDHFIYLADHQAPPPPPPVDHGCLPTQHWDESLQKCVENPEPNTGVTDIEGIQMLYEDDVSKAAQQWFLKGGDRSRLDGKGARKENSDGTISIVPDPGTTPASARVYIRTTNPKAFDEASQMKIGTDWTKMAQLGYMLDPFDYCDTEVSGYYKITRSSAADQFTFYWRGGAHSHNPFPAQCVACCNKVQIEMKDVSPRGAKEYHHDQSPSGYAWNDLIKEKFDLRTELGGSMVGKMLGQKVIMYNEKDSSGKVVKVHMELWVDTSSKDLPKPDLSKQNWRLFVEYIDDGTNWPDPKNDAYIAECNAKKGQMITWGGPYVALRLDDNDWTMHNLSIRPILPVKKK